MELDLPLPLEHHRAIFESFSFGSMELKAGHNSDSLVLKAIKDGFSILYRIQKTLPNHPDRLAL